MGITTIFIAAIVFVNFFLIANARECYLCQTNFNDEKEDNDNCYFVSNSTHTQTTSNGYCTSSFTIEDGIVISIYRGAVEPASDFDENSNLMPKEQCHTDIQKTLNPTQKTVCNIPCNITDNCNSIQATTLKACDSNCSFDEDKGSCDYLTSLCKCNAGFTGRNCATSVATTQQAAKRKCVQCNSATDEKCASFTISTDCPNMEEYCSTTKTTIYNQSFATIETMLTRGCSDNFVADDECSFTDIYTDSAFYESGYSEFTCYSTCNEDGCNTNTANGVLESNEQRLLLCQKCDGLDDSLCSIDACPTSSKFCISIVKYLISPRKDETYQPPEYKIENIFRGCSEKAETKQCTSIQPNRDSSFSEVTCTETCQEDGCNTGWPARPKCIRCSSYVLDGRGYDDDGYDECVQNPPEAVDCDYPYEGYCYIHDEGTEKGAKGTAPTGFPRRINRDCAYKDMGTYCTSSTLRGHTIQTCNRTCATNGCNVGNGSSKPIISLFTIMIPTAITWSLGSITNSYLNIF